MHYGPQIALARRHAGITQCELAEAAGLSQPYVSQLERNIKTPSLEALERIAAATGLELSVSFRAPADEGEKRSEIDS